MSNLVEHIKENFEFLCYAKWESRKGMQVDASSAPNLPGIYVMIDKNDVIQKIGKSSAGLKNRLNGYKSFDKSLQKNLDTVASGKHVRIDESSVAQRRGVEENNIEGVFVYFIAAQDIETEIAGFKTITHSFDAHHMEATVKAEAEAEGHPLYFGNK